IIADNYEEYAKQHGLSPEDALRELTVAAYRLVDDEARSQSFIEPEEMIRAEGFFNSHGAGNAISGTHGQTLFSATAEQRRNQLLNLSHVTASDIHYDPLVVMDSEMRNGSYRLITAAADDA